MTNNISSEELYFNFSFLEKEDDYWMAIDFCNPDPENYIFLSDYESERSGRYVRKELYGYSPNMGYYSLAGFCDNYTIKFTDYDKVIADSDESIKNLSSSPSTSSSSSSSTSFSSSSSTSFSNGRRLCANTECISFFRSQINSQKYCDKKCLYRSGNINMRKAKRNASKEILHNRLKTLINQLNRSEINQTTFDSEYEKLQNNHTSLSKRSLAHD
ncbi:MAG: hypothetical protein LBI56_03000 [Puniceicoccales bacterium]|jgi:hypothetical protein|nr:hypothetical protein [Puniceicoccales bacterium]